MEMYGMTGERLGMIGRAEDKAEDQLLSWQKEMISKPSISTRKGYAANYDPPYEDASVLVLTARSGKFVDIRFPKDMTDDQTTPEKRDHRPLSAYKAFWAFSGTAETTFYSSQNGGQQDSVELAYSAHVVFHHHIDSKGPGIVDEGDMFLLPNGDTMEVGMDTDSQTGKVKMYKEYWTAPDSPGMGAAGGVPGPPSKIPCIVAETTGEGVGHGIMIRIGDYCQGIYQLKEHSSEPGNLIVFRAEHKPVPDGTAGNYEWIMDPRSDLEHAREECMPYQSLFNEGSGLELGSKIPHHLDLWTITEIQ